MTSTPVDQLVLIHSPVVEYLEVLLALGGVLALAYLLLRIGLPGMMSGRTQGRGPIQILSRQAFTPKHTLHLVKVGSQVLLVATWETGVTFLAAISPENVVEIAEAQRATVTSPMDVLPWRRKSEK